MPLYDFKCIDCNAQFQHLELPPISETLELTCPDCQSTNTQKMISAPGVQFKGDGFYSTDAKKKEPEEKKGA